MKKAILAVLIALITLVTEKEAYAQTSLPKQNACQPLAEEILSLIKNAYNISLETNSVLVSGEVRSVVKLRHSNESQLAISLALAMAGKSIRTVSHPIYVIRPSKENQSKSAIEINVSDILKGLVKDVELQMGDVVFVSRGCSDGKLLQPTEPEYLPGEPTQKDYLFPSLDKRNTR